MKLVIAALFLASFNLSGRILDLNEKHTGFELGFAYSAIRNLDPATNRLQSGLTYSGNSSGYAYNSQFLFLFNMNSKVLIKGGFELIYPHQMGSITGSDSGGTGFVSGKTFIYGMNPLVGIDVGFVTGHSYRVFAGTEVGYGLLRYKTTWTYLPAGTAAGYSDFAERSSASSVSVNPYLGAEYTFVDIYGILIKAGYKYLKFSDIKASGSYTNGQNINVSPGERLLDLDGTARTVDLSGFTVIAAFRIYL
jgi:hypothetical protein